ncbi:MAG: peptide deformylase [Nitrospirota bacterium]|nr:peptide deformylase [Nitrospirota bacterium]MDH5586938.1 peptide deformylase [Nitrospirota bacterium]MDH5773951.1 peptide deformylase [Nitrospirota bacterium]
MPRILEISQLGSPVIRERAAKVTDIHDPQLQTLIDDLFATVAAENGMGIAAPQVSVSKRIIILSPKPNARYPYAPTMEPTAMINPEMTWGSPEREKDWEGCLTVPGIRGLVPRHLTIRVRYHTPQGVQIETEFDGFLARVFQHEADHLDGVVFLDRVESTLDLVTEGEWQNIIASRGPL